MPHAVSVLQTLHFSTGQKIVGFTAEGIPPHLEVVPRGMERAPRPENFSDLQ